MYWSHTSMPRPLIEFMYLHGWKLLICQSLVLNSFPPTMICCLSLKSVLPFNSDISQWLSIYMHSLIYGNLWKKIWKMEAILWYSELLWSLKPSIRFCLSFYDYLPQGFLISWEGEETCPLQSFIGGILHYYSFWSCWESHHKKIKHLRLDTLGSWILTGIKLIN